jgi:general stress protein 26
LTGPPHPRKGAAVFETDQELDDLDALLDRSFAGAGAHLTGIISPSRRLDARDLCRYLVGVKHFVLATTTASGAPRCSAVDGLFLHGRLWWTSSADSFKARHAQRRPAVSAAHVVGDDVGVFVHGTARLVEGGSPEASAISHYWHDIYGATPEDWVDDPVDARYAEIIPDAMFTYAFDRARFDALVGPSEQPSEE